MKYLSIFLLTIVCITSASATIISGTKYVGGGADSNFATIASAVAALNADTVGSGGVLFLVRPGTYTGSITINANPGSVAGNQVIFRKDTSTAGAVTIAATGTSATTDSIVKLYGASYITFDGIDVVDNGTSTTNYAERAFWLTNSDANHGAQNDTIMNCKITLHIQATQSWAIYQSSTGSGITTAGTQSNNHYLNLKISKVFGAIYMMGNSNTAYYDANCEIGSTNPSLSFPNRFVIGANNTITGDTILSGGTASTNGGVWLRYQNNPVIHNIDVTNMIVSGTSVFMNCVFLYSSTGSVQFYGNRIFNNKGVSTAGRVYVYGIEAQCGSGCNTYIYNNLFYGLTTTSPVAASTGSTVQLYGIYSSSNTPVYVYNNSVLLAQNISANPTADLSYTSECVNARSPVYMNDNVLYNKCGPQTVTGAKHYDVVLTSGSLTSDNNVFYLPDTIHGYLGVASGDRRLLSDWQTTGRDLNSLSGNPIFVSDTLPYDLHIRTGIPYTPVENTGIAISAPIAVTTDIEGNPRDPLHPDIGAFEGTFTSVPPLLAASPNPASFGTVQTGFSASVLITVQNNGVDSLRITNITSPANITPSWTTHAPILTNASDTLRITWNPVAEGTLNDSLRIYSNASDSIYALHVTGTAVHTVIAAIPDTIPFGTVQTASTITIPVIIQNTGTGNLSITNITTPVNVTPSWTTHSPLGAGAFDTLRVSWHPVASTVLNDSLVIHSNAVNATNYSLYVTGSAIRSVITAIPDTTEFGSVVVGSMASFLVNIQNTGNDSLRVSGITSPANISTSWTTHAPIAPGSSDTLRISWLPTALGTLNDSIIVHSDAMTPNYAIRVMGSARRAVIVAIPDTAYFGSVQTGDYVTVTITISNTGNDTLRITDIAAPVGIIPTWTTRLPMLPGSSDTLQLTWHPTAPISFFDAIVIHSNATNVMYPVYLSGTATGMPDIGLSSNSVNFGYVVVGGSNSIIVYIRSTGTIPLNLTGVTTPARFTHTLLVATLNPGDSAALTLNWQPTTEGSFSGYVVVNSNSVPTPHDTIVVTGFAYIAPGVPVISITYTMSDSTSHMFWTRPMGTISGYNIYRYGASGLFDATPTRLIATISDPNSTSYQDPEIGRSGDHYYYKVTAFNVAASTSSTSLKR